VKEVDAADTLDMVLWYPKEGEALLPRPIAIDTQMRCEHTLIAYIVYIVVGSIVRRVMSGNAEDHQTGGSVRRICLGNAETGGSETLVIL
jgi:hypothetical protein